MYLPRKTYHRNGRHWIVAAIITLLTLAACSDDDSATKPEPKPEDPKDTDQPTVTVTGIAADAVVWNTVTLTVAADDNDAVKQVEINLDDKPVLTKTDATTFTYALDTTPLADGAHTVTVTVTDATGNKKAQAYTFTVQNTLVSIDIPGDFLEGEAKGFVFLSDNTGQVIVNHQYENGEAIRLTASTFNGTEFYLTEVFVDEYKQQLRTYTQIPRGSTWSLATPGQSSIATTVGKAALTFTDAVSGSWYGVSAGFGDDKVWNALPNLSLDLVKSSNKLYITRRPESDKANITHYLLTDPVSVGNSNTPISLAAVANPMEDRSTDLDGPYAGDVAFYGLTTPGDLTNRYLIEWIQLAGSQHVDYKYPGNGFPAYYARVDLSTFGHSISNHTDGLPDLTPVNSSLEVKMRDGVITGTVTGDDVDYAEFHLEYNTYLTWYFTAPKGSIDITIPTVPDNVKVYASPMSIPNYSQVTAVQKFDFDGYDGFRQFVPTSGYGSLDKDQFSARYKRYTVYIDQGSNGRQRAFDPFANADSKSQRPAK